MSNSLDPEQVPDDDSDLICAESVCKGHQQMTSHHHDQ